ncbi:MAG: hypothetical protein H8E44_46075 [Planctomycetes bacterium]|nr:hypothetical protein [Planctomycetota bacterium]MBL7044721.1 hypothetical protein [Pirellulaceae bacterium]
MPGRSNRLSIALTAAVVMLAATCAHAESFTLELKRLATSPSSPEESVFRSTYPQSFYMRSGMGTYSQPGGEVPNFSTVIKKEPSKYQTDKPFRGVAKLGSQHFGFVLDTAAKEKDKSDKDKEEKEKPSGKKREFEIVRYNRLLFDLNHNGDLTDDEVIAAKEPRGTSRQSNYANYAFPRVDLTIETDGVEMEYAFNFSVYSYGSTSYSYASASLNAAAYRDGQVTLDGEKKRIVLVDYNSNGRFDDGWSIDPRTHYSGGGVYPKKGDMIFVAPDANVTSGSSPTTNDSQQYLSKLVNVEGSLFDIKVSPAGDKLTLTPSSIPVGQVTNPNKGYRAVVYSDIGLIKISGDDSGKATLPEGKWKLASYTIDRTGFVEEKKEKEKEEEATSLLDTLSAALTQNQRASRPRSTRISAYGTDSYVAVKVRGGETVEFPFGPPYTPKVTVSHGAGSSTASLGMSLIGSGGERCSGIYVNGSRPPSPAFTITDPDGKEVQTGNFEYG